MAFVLIATEWRDPTGERGRELDRSLDVLAVKCHNLTMSTAVWRTDRGPEEVARHMRESGVIAGSDRFVVVPIADLHDDRESWVAHNPLSASKCFNL